MLAGRGLVSLTDATPFLVGAETTIFDNPSGSERTFDPATSGGSDNHDNHDN